MGILPKEKWSKQSGGPTGSRTCDPLEYHKAVMTLAAKIPWRTPN